LRDTNLLDFNFCDIYDPDLQSGPNQSYLYRLAIESRNAVRGSAFEFANTMYWTLRPTTFYSKLLQYFSVLLFDKVRVHGLDVYGMGVEPRTEEPWEEGVLDGDAPIIQEDEIEHALVPEDNESERVNWYELVQTLSKATGNRLDLLRAWLNSQRQTRTLDFQARSHRGRNPDRETESPADVIDRLRGAQNWTIEELAGKADVDIKQVYKVKRGEGVHTDTVRKLAGALGCKPGDLLPE
jgi:DNA-binding Xre family transcriptional regulator